MRGQIRITPDSSPLACYPEAMAKKKPIKKKAAPKDAVPFETSLEELRQILGDLEEGNLPLSESLEKYEAGIAHLRNCHVSLNEAKARIKLLVRVDKDGKAITKPYDHSATVAEKSPDSVSENEKESLQEELDHETEEDGDWDGGLF